MDLMPAAFSSSTQTFVVLWVYTACPVIAVAELHDNGAAFNTAGTAVTFAMSFAVALFYFGLYEAGRCRGGGPASATPPLPPLLYHASQWCDPSPRASSGSCSTRSGTRTSTGAGATASSRRGTRGRSHACRVGRARPKLSEGDCGDSWAENLVCSGVVWLSGPKVVLLVV